MTRRYVSALFTASFLLARCGGGTNPGNDSGASDANQVPDVPRANDGGGSTDAGNRADTGNGGTDAGNRADTGSGNTDAGNPADTGTGNVTLAAIYPCDRGLANDPSVVWAEDFEEGSVSAITARYDDTNHVAGMSLTADTPGSCGGSSMTWVSGVSNPATHLYKSIAPHDEVYVRWYAKYQPGIQWHHSGMWFGGYDPAETFPNPQAGYRPNGDDRFSISVEPVWNIQQPGTRFDFYNYWMGMHSWELPPPSDNPGDAYYGNALAHSNAFTIDEGSWVCLEVHAKLNTDLSSSTGAVLEVWKNDTLIAHFDDQAPVGCWIRDKFCAQGVDGNECTDYPDLCTQPYVPLDMQFRSTAALPINAFWPQNYITEGPDGAMQVDQMVVATRRVGCLR